MTSASVSPSLSEAGPSRPVQCPASGVESHPRALWAVPAVASIAEGTGSVELKILCFVLTVVAKTFLTGQHMCVSL